MGAQGSSGKGRGPSAAHRVMRLLAGADIVLGMLVVSSVSAGPKWQRIDDGDPAPYPSAIYWDAGAGRVTLMQGLGEDDGNPDTARPPWIWRLEGEDWRRISVPEPSAQRVKACSAYDSDRNVLVVFGNLESDETWEFNGSVWIERLTATKPAPRAWCAMAYDDARNRIVMNGGWAGSGAPILDTWEYDGVNWVQRSPTSAPSARAYHAMTFDPDRNVVLLFGGRQGLNPVYFKDTWEWNGTNWAQRNTPSSPSARAAHSLAYDGTRHRAVLFGGYNLVQPHGDTWEWNGSQWSLKSPAIAPSARWDFPMTFDPSRNVVVAFGGEFNDGRWGETWTYDGTVWLQVAVSNLPRPREQFGLAFDDSIDRLVLQGGKDVWRNIPDNRLSDTWLFNGASWSQDTTTLPPSSFDAIPLAFDKEADSVVGFGGGIPTGVGVSDDVHRYLGSPRSWSSVSSCCSGPPPRDESQLVYRAGGGGSLLFGGWACCFLDAHYAADDTWLLQADVWTEQSTTIRPPGRRSHGMAYDSSRNRVLLYGGFRPGLTLADTWVFDGSNWTMLSESSTPGHRPGGVALAYDASRDRVVLFGGGHYTETVTWEFDGSNWLAISTPFMPDPHRSILQMAYDSKREVIWLFGGTFVESPQYYNDTWAYGADPDDDGIVGKLDNCVQVSNSNQLNVDLDAAGDVCDCAAIDAGSFALPLESVGLTVAGKAPSNLGWSDQAPSAGSATTYDVVSGSVIDLRTSGFPGAGCLVNSSAALSYADSRTPAAGDGFWYLVRARNACGTGTYGRASLDAASPCP